jgi:hypothetical protein
MMKDIAWTVFFFVAAMFAFQVVTNPALTLDSNPIMSRLSHRVLSSSVLWAHFGCSMMG